MPYAILRFAKKKMGGVTAAYAHNERKKDAYQSNPDIKLECVKNNYHLMQPKQTYRKEIQAQLAKAGCKVRSNSTVLVETLITASPEWMHALSPQEQREYFTRAFDFMAEKIGKDNIISAVVHMDEKTPHMHLSFCPITEDKRLSAKTLLGNQAQLSQWQTAFHMCLSGRWDTLERGVSAMTTKRRHIPVWLFKQAESLDKQFDGIVGALADINALNAGRKRDKALSMLAAWLPEAERFTAQLKTVSNQIKWLEADAAQSEAAARHWEGEANQIQAQYADRAMEIRRLRSLLEKQKQLLKRVPPDVLSQLRTKDGGIR